MPKLSKAAVKEKVAEWESLGKKVRKAGEAMEAELAPALKRFETATKDIRTYHEPKIQKLMDQQSAIAKEVIAWLEEQKKDIAVETETAIAERKTGLGPRVIEPERFIEAAKAKGDAMWKCVNILIANAERLLGKKELDAISTRPPAKPKAQLRLK